MTFTILALDPGGTTGWATYQAEHSTVPGEFTWSDEKWNCGQLEGNNHHDALYTLLELSHTAEFHIVCESFEYRNQSRTGVVLISKEYIGVVNLFAQQRNIVGNVHYQTAAQGKVTGNSFIKKHNLQAAGLWSPGFGHAMDAYAHMLYWMISGPLRRHDLLKWLGK